MKLEVTITPMLNPVIVMHHFKESS